MESKIWNIIDLFFKQTNSLYDFHYKSYEEFIEDIVIRELKENENIILLKDDKINNRIIKYYFRMTNIKFLPPQDNKGKIIFPENARQELLSYSSKLIADVEQIQEIYYIKTDKTESKVFYQEKEVPIAKIPVMVRSKYCSTNIYNTKNSECVYDPGCYFIIKGQEKVILTLEKMCENKIFVFEKDDKGVKHYTSLVNSKHRNTNINMNILKIEYKENTKENNLIVNSTNFKDLQLIILLKAMGIQDDKTLIDIICYGNRDFILLVKKLIYL